jgi:hypothetical protein
LYLSGLLYQDRRPHPSWCSYLPLADDASARLLLPAERPIAGPMHRPIINCPPQQPQISDSTVARTGLAPHPSHHPTASLSTSQSQSQSSSIHHPSAHQQCRSIYGRRHQAIHLGVTSENRACLSVQPSLKTCRELDSGAGFNVQCSAPGADGNTLAPAPDPPADPQHLPAVCRRDSGAYSCSLASLRHGHPFALGSIGICNAPRPRPRCPGVDDSTVIIPC